MRNAYRKRENLSEASLAEFSENFCAQKQNNHESIRNIAKIHIETSQIRFIVHLQLMSPPQNSYLIFRLGPR